MIDSKHAVSANVGYTGIEVLSRQPTSEGIPRPLTPALLYQISIGDQLTQSYLDGIPIGF